jgi:hypothetical protein
MFHYIVLNIIYICVCAKFVVIIICVLFVGRWQSISCDNFLSNLIAVLFVRKSYNLNPLLLGLVWFWFLVFNATFNNISVISWWSVLLVEATGVPGENHRPVASHQQTLSHNVVSSTHRHEWGWTHNYSGDRHWLHR